MVSQTTNADNPETRRREMRRLRRIATRIERTDMRAWVGSHLYRWRQMRRALSPVAAKVAIARRLGGKGLARQLVEQSLLVLRFRFNPELYYDHGLFEPERYRRAEDWVSHRQIAYLMNALNPDGRKPLTDDKSLFAEHCAGHGIPHPVTLGLWDPAREDLPAFAEDFHACAENGGVVCKSLEGTRGEDMAIIRSDGAGQWWLSTEDSAETAMDWASVKTRLIANQTAYLCQKRLTNDPGLAEFGETPLHTVRMLTVMRGDQFEPLLAVLRIGRAGAIADNFKQGGLGAALDIGDGRLGRGCTFAADCLPGSRGETAQGVSLDGRAVPRWSEVLELARMVHASLADFPFLSQDIAVTSDGVLAIEVNQVWSVDLLQKVHDVGLGATPFRRHCLAALEDAGL